MSVSGSGDDSRMPPRRLVMAAAVDEQIEMQLPLHGGHPGSDFRARQDAIRLRRIVPPSDHSRQRKRTAGRQAMQGSQRVIAMTALAFAAAAAAIMPARAQDYPSRPIYIITGFGPGSSGDVVSRAIGAPMSRTLGQQVVSEGRPGAGGSVAAQFVARAPADGYALLNGSNTNVTNSVLQAICRTISARTSCRSR